MARYGLWSRTAERETLRCRNRRQAGTGRPGGESMARFLVHWFSIALALLVCTKILHGVRVDSLETLAVAALVLGFINAIIRPILVILTLPITVVTLGLFYFVINGLAFMLASAIVPGFAVDSFGWAMVGSLVVSAVSWFLGSFARRQDWRP